MAIPAEIKQDIEVMAGDGELDLHWPARRVAARLRGYGFVEAPAWIEANEAEYDGLITAGTLKPDHRNGA